MKRPSTRKSAAPPLPVLAPENLPYQMFLLVQQMTRRFQQVLSPHGLTPLHWGILCCLWREDGLRTTQIAERLEQLGGTLTVGLNAMERDGLIERRKDGADGRVSRVFLTRTGRALQKVLEPAAAALLRDLFRTLTSQQYGTLADQIVHLRGTLASRDTIEQHPRANSPRPKPVSKAAKSR